MNFKCMVKVSIKEEINDHTLFNLNYHHLGNN